MCNKYGVQLKYMAQDSPQLNGVVEYRMAVLLNETMSFPYIVNISDEYCKNYWHVTTILWEEASILTPLGGIW